MDYVRCTLYLLDVGAIAVYTGQCTLYNVQYTLYNVQCTVSIEQTIDILRGRGQRLVVW